MPSRRTARIVPVRVETTIVRTVVGVPADSADPRASTPQQLTLEPAHF